MIPEIKAAIRAFCEKTSVTCEIREWMGSVRSDGGDTVPQYIVVIDLSQVAQLNSEAPAQPVAIQLTAEGVNEQDAWMKILKKSVYTAVESAWHANISRIIHSN